MKKLRKRTRWLLLAGLVLFVALFTVPQVLAFESRGGDEVVIPAGEVIDDDLYVTAGVFTLDGTVTGDLIAVGGTLNINGTVEGDLIAAGQSVIVNGVVEDDARITGYALTIAGNVGDDVVSAGFSIEVEEESAIGGDIVYAGAQALVNGDVEGNLSVAGGAVLIAGDIAGDVQIDVGGAEDSATMSRFYNYIPNMPPVPSVPGGLTITDEASIGGDVDYIANNQAAIPSGTVEGEVDFTRHVPKERQRPGYQGPSPVVMAARWALRQVRHFLALLLVGALMMWLVPVWTRERAENIAHEPLPSLGWGVVALLAFGALMIVLGLFTVLLALLFGAVTLGDLGGPLVSLGGILTGVAGLTFSVLWRYVTQVVVSLLLGMLIFRLFNSATAEHRWWPLLLGIVVFVIITAVPLLGWLVKLIAVLLGLGALWMWGLEALRQRQATTSPPPPVEVEA